MHIRLMPRLAVGAVVALAIGAIGCGDTPKERFIAHGEALCGDLAKSTERALRPVEGRPDPDAMIERVGKEVRAARSEYYRRFAALDAPDGHARALQDRLRRVVHLENAVLVAVRDMEGDGELSANQVRRLAQAPSTRRFLSAAHDLNADMQSYGFTCPAKMTW